MQTMRLRWIACSAVLVFLSRTVQSQALHGVVVESQSGRPVAGAVVLLLDSAGLVATRAVTSGLGTFTMRRPPEAVRGRVVRLGFRPHDIDKAELDAAVASGELAISINAIPMMLEPVVSHAPASCPKRKDREAAFGFWEQAKAGLMASVYAREGNPGFFTTLIYEKYLRRNTDSVVIQRVRADSGSWTRTFQAAFTAKDFVDVGFVRLTDDLRYTFYGPDAEVLLENDFQIRYCFSLAAHNPKRPTQVGLRFQPVKVRITRVDIDGTFWIDTAARQLRDIEFAYVGIRGGAERYRPGGTVTFRELANGVPFVDAWTIRMVTMVTNRGQQTVLTFGDVWGGMSRHTYQYDVTVGGGVLAHARWPDGTRYDAPLGTARIFAMRDDGTPVPGQRIDLDSTFYGGVTDSAGYLVITDMLPGPYHAIIGDTILEPIGLKLRSTLEFVAVADSLTDAVLPVHDAAAAITRLCKGQQYDGWAVLIARATTPDNQPIKGVHWQIGDSTGLTTGTTTDDGIILPCMKLRIPSSGVLLVWRDEGFPSFDHPAAVEFGIKDIVTAVRVELRFPKDSKTPPPLKP